MPSEITASRLSPSVLSMYTTKKGAARLIARFHEKRNFKRRLKLGFERGCRMSGSTPEPFAFIRGSGMDAIK